MRILSVAVLAMSMGLAGCTQKPEPLPDPLPEPEVTPAPAAAPAPVPAGKRPAGQENAPPPAWRAFGNEPFWSARVEGDKLVFSTPDNIEGVSFDGVQTPLADGLRFEGREGTQVVSLEIHAGECSDGMSDTQHAYVSRLRLSGMEYNGCAEAAK